MVSCLLFCSLILYLIFFFFKQKTAYEMRISDWSSDVCSSDLWPGDEEDVVSGDRHGIERVPRDADDGVPVEGRRQLGQRHVLRESLHQIGRASCRERVCQYV